jgi:predicted methyltransferase
MNRTVVSALFGLLASVCACAGESGAPPAAAPATTDLHAAVSSTTRPAEERARDAYRHPEETLAFFGLRPDMNVVELSPGGGWYTAILAPVLAEHGKLHVTNGDPNGPPDSGATKRAKVLLARFLASPATFGKVEPIIVDWKAPSPLGPDGSQDLVVTFRNVHNWVQAGTFDAVLAGAFKVLKPGGVLGVEEHRAASGVTFDAKVVGDTGYVPESFVVERATAAGFKLVARSEINANAKDTKDYPKGVWTLPPTYELGDKDRAKYATIGESDRMTLRFQKP